MKKISLIFLLFSSMLTFAQDKQDLFVGKWLQSEAIILDEEEQKMDTSNFEFNDWSYEFYQNGTFLENRAFVCNNDSIQVQGKWKSKAESLTLKVKSKCSLGEISGDCFENIEWISDNYWIVRMKGENDKVIVYAFKRF